MTADGTPRRILALGGGGFTGSVEDSALDEFVVSLGVRARPRVCLLPTAGGDAQEQIDRFYRSFGPLDCELSCVSLFRLGGSSLDLREHLLSRDVIYVAGGSMLNLLALWRVHQVDTLLEEAWRAGVALCGVSAGTMCWFESGITRARGDPGPATGLGLLPGSASVHDASDPRRRAAYREAVAAGMAGGYAIEDGVGLLFAGRELAEAVSSRPGAAAHRVELDGGGVVEHRIEPRLLPQEPGHAVPEPLAIAEFREAQRRSRSRRNSLRSIPPV